MIWIWLVLFCLVVWLGGYAVGSLLLRHGAAADRALFAFPLGGAAIGWIQFCSSEFGAPISSTMLYLIALPMGGAGAVMLWREMRRRRDDQQNILSAPTKWTWIAWVQMGVIVVLLTRQILESITEPYIGMDALRYHFPFAHLIFKSHALPQFTSPSMGDLFFTNPPLPFLWYADIWLWAGTPHLFLPVMTTVIMAGHLCLLLYRMARRILGVSPEVALGVILLLFLPGVFTNLLQVLRSSTDIPFAFWGVATAYWWLQDGVENASTRWAWVGLCGGMMAWIKPYGYLLGLTYVGLMAVWWWRYRHREGVWTYQFTTIIKVISLWSLIVLPLPFHHWLSWGNPIYPVFGRVFGGLLINEWSLQHNLMLLNIFSWDGYGILSQVFSEPIAALGGVAILHPEVRKNPIRRLLWLIPMGYMLLYLLLFGSTISNMIPGAHVRYLLPGVLLFGLFVSCFLDNGLRLAGKAEQGILLAALSVQAALILYPVLSDGGILRQISPGNPDTVVILFYEWLALFLVGGFLITGWIGRHMFRLRLGLLALGCVFMTYPWSLAAPWQLITRPLESRFMDWTAAPVVSPHGPWMHEHLPRSAVLLINDDRRWLIPRQIIPADSPLLADIYTPDTPFMKKLERLAELGITHMVTTGVHGQPAPLSTDWLMGAPAWNFLAEPEGERFFALIYSGQPVSYREDPVGYTTTEVHLFRIAYPPDLLRICEAPIPRPWLYEYATNGLMGR